MIIVLDVDDVCADLSATWLSAYNKDYGDTLEPRHIRSWDMSAWVKPACGKKIYDYIRNPHIYDSVVPVRDAVFGANWLARMGHRIVYATAYVKGIEGRKYEWLHTNGFPINERDYVEIADKSLIHGDVIFDDKLDNIVGFHGKYRFLMLRPWSGTSFVANYHAVNSWNEFLGNMLIGGVLE